MPEFGGIHFFSRHQAGVVVEATARLIPGTSDEPEEKGHPGARELGVVDYIDGLLSALDSDPPRIYAGGPWSDRAGGDTNHFSNFLPLTRVERNAWERRIQILRDIYSEGVALLDRLAGGDFANSPPSVQDTALASPEARSFRLVLFQHSVEAMLGCPEYGGNTGQNGWKEIGFEGDIQPRGFRAGELRGKPDPIIDSEIIRETLSDAHRVIRALRSRR